MGAERIRVMGALTFMLFFNFYTFFLNKNDLFFLLLQNTKYVLINVNSFGLYSESQSQ